VLLIPIGGFAMPIRGRDRMGGPLPNHRGGPGARSHGDVAMAGDPRCPLMRPTMAWNTERGTAASAT